MPRTPNKIAIVGAGIAGSRLAKFLADEGKEVLLFDHKVPWEKPCGGGLTAKAMGMIPEAPRLGLDGRSHKRMLIRFPAGRRVSLGLSRPMYTVSRAKLGRAMLDQALSSGARFHDQKTLAVTVEDGVSVVRTGSGEYEADLVVGADGVNSKVRQSLAKSFDRADLCRTFSALIPTEVQTPVIISLMSDVMGYAWLFPRKGATSVGIAMENPGVTHDQAKERLRQFADDEFKLAGLAAPELDGLRGFYLPSLRPESFSSPVLGGEGWALVGDASGTCDSITGEGIYYALKTADFLGAAVTGPRSARYLEKYVEAWGLMAGNSLAKMSGWRERFYRARNLRFLGYCLDYSPGIRSVTRRLIDGTQKHSSLKKKILENWRRYARETISNTIRMQKGERDL